MNRKSEDDNGRQCSACVRAQLCVAYRATHKNILRMDMYGLTIQWALMHDNVLMLLYALWCIACPFFQQCQTAENSA